MYGKRCICTKLKRQTIVIFGAMNKASFHIDRQHIVHADQLGQRISSEVIFVGIYAARKEFVQES